MIARYDADLALWIVPTIFWVRKGSWKLKRHPLASLGRESQKFTEKMSRKMRLNGLERIPKDFSLNPEAYRGNLISDGCHPLWQILCLWKMKTYGKDRDHTWDHYWVDISCYVPMTLTSQKPQRRHMDCSACNSLGLHATFFWKTKQNMCIY